YEISYRVVKEDGNLIWVNQHSRHILDENGRELVMAYYIDITEQKQMGEKAKANEKKYETLINSIPGGVGMYKLNETFTPIFISHRVYELCGMTQEEYCKATEKSTLDVFHPEDRQGIIDVVKVAYEEKRKFEYIHRVLQKDGSYRWMRVSGQVMTVEGETPILYTVFTDVHEQIQAEQALRESEFRYAIAIKSSNINIWEYEYSKDTLLIVSKSPRISGQGSSIENYIYEAINGKHLREDCITVFLDTIEKMKKGAKELTLDIWLRLQVDDDYWCERVTCTNIFDQGGIPVKAYCVGRDVTKEKEAEKRYQEEVS
ncbi:MAG: PAS domain-containing protein, partial [Anaerovorax sp.]